MTDQVQHLVFYNDEEYKLCNSAPHEFFDPRVYRLNPKGVATNCHRGWNATLEISEYLNLKQLLVYHDTGLPIRDRFPNGPSINGISPEKPIAITFNCFYNNLNLTLDFTGSILIGKDRTSSIKGRPMGGSAFWMYESLLELSFESGKQCFVKNLSGFAQQTRENYIEPFFGSYYKLIESDDFRQAMIDTFSGDYGFTRIRKP